MPIHHSFNIVIITRSDLPEGAGNTSRLKTLTACLTRMGHSVKIWNEHALGVVPDSVLRPKGTIGEVEYEYILGTTQRPYGFFSVYMKLKSLFLILRRLLGEQDRHQIVWLNNLSFYDTLPITLFARKLRMATIQSYEDDRLELCSTARLGVVRRIFGLDSYLADRCLSKTADAVVVISRYLKNKYESLKCKDVFIIPTIVNAVWWASPAKTPQNELSFLYSGAFGEQDELVNLIHAFHVLKNDGYGFKLTLIGNNFRAPDVIEKLKQMVFQLHLEPYISFEDFMPLDEIRRKISEYDVLIAIRRNTPWGSSGLPTKLSEYLATGRPVISSAVGDIPFYLKNRVNAFLVPDTTTAQDIVHVLRQCFELKDELQNIGKRGAEVAKLNFDESAVMENLAPVLEKAVSNAKSNRA